MDFQTKDERREAAKRKTKKMRVNGVTYVRLVTRLIEERADGKRGTRN